MTNIKSYKVKILNKSYEIKGPESEEANLVLAAEQLNEQVMINKNKYKQLDDFKSLLLAALEISHQMILCKNDQENQRIQVTQFITSLENKINKTVIGDADSMPQTD